MELLAVFSPLCAFLIAGIFGGRIGDRGCQLVTCAALILAAFVSCILFYEVALQGHAYTTVLGSWVVSGDFSVNWALRLDTLSVVMMCVINIVSACVHVYSVGYMSHDPAKGRFMAYLSLFTFAMLMLVSADNLLQIFFGWEGVGLASYLLIGFWSHKHSANAAAMKAFIVNRVGDLGLTLGVMVIFVVFGTIEFDTIFAEAPHYADSHFEFWGFQGHALTIACLLLFVGAVGKSAQLGLHTWLPDAMEGPTPVSALIHAATMVTAGVFLVARFSPVFEYAPVALMVVTIVGACTAFVAATVGMTQFDIKRVIAYSTMSQLGYMFFALGVSAYGAAMFHLVTHAFFKALLFLGAGSVIHAMSDEQDMRKMGGIWKKIPVTYVLMWIGSLALAGIGVPGVFGFAGFYSKDIVLEAAWADHTWFGEFAYWMGIAAALMTAFYSWRLILMTFHGAPRASKKVMDHIHESPSVMLLPLFVLAFGALFSGVILYQSFVGGAGHHGSETQHAALETSHAKAGEAHEKIIYADEHFEVIQTVSAVSPSDLSEISPVAGGHDSAKDTHDGVDEHHAVWAKEAFWGSSLKILPGNDTVDAAHGVPMWVKLTPLAVGVFGIFLGYVFYLFRPGWPAKVVSLFSYVHALFFNKWYFDELYTKLFVKNAFKLGQALWYRGDQGIIDRYGPNGVAALSQKLAGALSRFQSGFVYQYAFVMIIAVIAVISWFIFKMNVGM